VNDVDATGAGRPARGSDSRTNGWGRVEICGELARQRAEGLQLEIRRLAKRCGVEVTRLVVERVTHE
jgi:hypothetical protein